MMIRQHLVKLNKEKTAWILLVIQSVGQLDYLNAMVQEEIRSDNC